MAKQQRDPRSNAPDTYTGDTVSPEGFPYQFGLRGGIAAKGEDPAKTYVVNGANGPMKMLLYDGQSFGSAQEIREYVARTRDLGYSNEHATSVDDVAGVGYPVMTKEESDEILRDFDAAPDDRSRYFMITAQEQYALQNRGLKRADINASIGVQGAPPDGWQNSPLQARRDPTSVTASRPGQVFPTSNASGESSSGAIG